MPLRFPAIVCFILAAGLLAVSPVSAQNPPQAAPVTEQQEARRRALEEDRAAIERLREELLAQSNDVSRRFSTLQVGEVSEVMVDQIGVDIEALRLRQEELQAEIANTERRIKELEQSIQELETRIQLLKNPARGEEDSVARSEEIERAQQLLAQLQTDLSLEKQHLENLRNRLDLANQRLALVKQWQARVEELYRLRQEQSRQEALEDLESRLQRERQAYLDLAAKLSQQLERARDALPEARQRLLETEIAVAEEQANLTQLAIRLVSINAVLARLDDLAAKTDPEPEELREGLRQVRELSSELQTSYELLQRKIEIFQQRRQLIERRQQLVTEARGIDAEEKRHINAVLEELEALHEQVQQRIGQAEAVQARLEARYKEVLSEHLLFRGELPATLEEWNQLLAGMAEVRRILLYQVRLSLESTLNSMAEAGASRWLGLIFSELGLLALLLLIRYGSRRLKGLFRATEEIGFFHKIIKFAAELVRRNLVGIGVSAALLIAIWILQVPQPGRSIIMTVVLLWIGIKIPIDLAWMVLDSPNLPAERRRPRLYRHWFHTLFFGGILAAMIILVQLSDVTETVSDAFERIFMIYLLLVTLPVLRARRFFIDLLARQYAGQYWFSGLRLISFLLPLSLFVTAVLGLVGYLNLAWTVAWYLVLSIAVLALWLLVQGLFKDLIGLAKDYAARRGAEALLWPQEIIDPVYKIVSILLFLGACTVLVRLVGWDQAYTLTTAWQVLAVAVFSVMAAYEAVYFIAGIIVRRTQSVFGNSLVRHSRQPLGIILPIAAAQAIVPTLPLAEETFETIRHMLVLVQIAAVSWLLVRLVWVFDDLAVHRYVVETQDKLGARRVRTQMRMLRQIVIFSVWLIAISAILMTFPKVRQLGTGLLASAGVLGLVIGIAARPFLANLIAGVQIGLTQPIRLDDEVIVENEWGRIEEINPTHVIIRIWDDRRLVIPLNYFNEKPFQNWTRTSTNLIGVVFVHVDYAFPVEEGRQELKRILDTTDLWDGQVQVLQVTDAKDSTLELRLLMSARDAPTAWDLRCYVREKFVEFVQKNYPHCLPRTRAVLVQDKPGSDIFVPGVPNSPKSSTA